MFRQVFKGLIPLRVHQSFRTTLDNCPVPSVSSQVGVCIPTQLTFTLERQVSHIMDLCQINLESL
jgi:hypothetical protein